MKPTLFLHCGMYKTGSSFLQTMFVRNRDLLKKRSIHYPKSKQELEMYKGEITAGNGIHLSDILGESEADIAKLLTDDLTEAKKMNMASILYSSEILFHRFVEKGMVQNLQRAAKMAGFEKVDALVYFRDPVSHAISTYKHRAKYGDHQNFQKWLHTKYELIDMIESFLTYSETSNICWTCRKYKSNSDYMVRSSFVDWLGGESPGIPLNDRVNRSLQLNEIRVLQSLKKRYPGSEDFLRNSLLSLNDEDKQDERELIDEYSHQIADLWRDHQSMLTQLNSCMRENEKLMIDFAIEKREKKSYVSLSENQIAAVAEGFKSYMDSEKITYKMQDVFVRGINKIRRKWVASRLNYRH